MKIIVIIISNMFAVSVHITIILTLDKINESEMFLKSINDLY